MMMKRPFILGLTGSIGMGKTATARIFATFNVPVWDADAAVHELYYGDTAAVHGISNMVPNAVKDQQVDRGILKQEIKRRPALLKEIEALVHPLVAELRQEFLSTAASAGAKMVVIDHPILFETKGDALCDAVLVVTAPEAEQKRRVLAREGMTAENYQFILSRQMPDKEKRVRADYILETTTPEAALDFVRALILTISGDQADA